jgi:hypothetical protein
MQRWARQDAFSPNACRRKAGHVLLTCDALTTTASTSASGSTPVFWNTVGRKHLHAQHTPTSERQNHATFAVVCSHDSRL